MQEGTRALSAPLPLPKLRPCLQAKTKRELDTGQRLILKGRWRILKISMAIYVNIDVDLNNIRVVGGWSPHLRGNSVFFCPCHSGFFLSQNYHFFLRRRPPNTWEDGTDFPRKSIGKKIKQLENNNYNLWSAERGVAAETSNLRA